MALPNKFNEKELIIMAKSTWAPTPEMVREMNRARKTGKEFFYVGHYISESGEYVFKVGTTNDPKRRRAEHNRAYAKTPNHPMRAGTTFEYDWLKALSKYTTLRIEDREKERFQAENFGCYLNNDRFIFAVKPPEVKITVRKTYTIAL